MEREKTKFKTEPEYNYQRTQSLPGFDRLDLDFEKHILESENRTEKLKNSSDVRVIKTEEMINYDENQMLFNLNNKLWELKNQILEKDRVVGAYQAQEETRVAKMEKEIEGLKLQKQMDDQTIEGLRRRVLVLEEEKREAERAAKVIASELLKADETVKELRRSVMMELNVDDLKNKLVGPTGTVSHASSDHIIEILDDSDDEDKEMKKLGSSSPVGANDRQTNKRKEISTDCCHVHRRLLLQRK